ncbi:MAG: glutamate racemase [Clostridia bacterium]|nr:glutamate racemase [Clostridia bacterium]
MDKRELPIAVFDSGLGGISVLKRLCRKLPSEKFIYFGDSKYAPYGEKSREWILSRSIEIAENFISEGIKALVVACNTATSVAVKTLRERYPDIPVIGLEPALKIAVESGREGAVVVMATPVTLSGEKFSALLERFKEEKKIILMPAPKLVEFVENGEYGGEAVEEYLKELLLPYKGSRIASVVLGCTHFPFLKEAISKVFGDVDFYDGAVGTANETARQLELRGLLSEENNGFVAIDNSLGDEMSERSWELFEREI